MTALSVFARKSSGKMLIFAIVGILVLLAGGGFAYMKLGKGKGKGAKAKVEKPTVLVPLEEFVVNLADTEQARYIKIQVTLEVESEKKGETMEEDKPRLRDAIIFVLGQKSYNELLSTSGKTRLKEDIRVACNRGLDRDVVKEVLFTDFAMQ